MDTLTIRKKREGFLNIAVFIILLALYSYITLLLFYRQARMVHERYPSDMTAYVAVMLGEYPGRIFTYPLFFRLGQAIDIFLSPNHALSISVAAMLLNSICPIVLKIFFDRFFSGRLAPFFNTVLLFSLLFVSMLYDIPGISILVLPDAKYSGVFSANPWHNATYLVARGFAVLTFFEFTALFGKLNKSDTSLSEYAAFAVLLLLSTMAKPSFTIIFLITAGLMLLTALIAAGFENFPDILRLSLSFIPTLINLLFQYIVSFDGGAADDTGLAFSFGKIWSRFCTNIPLSIPLAMLFPIVVLICGALPCCKKYEKNNILYLSYKASWLLYIVSFCTAFFLYIKGSEAYDFDFSWGYQYGIFFVFLTSLFLLIERTRAVFKDTDTRTRTLLPERIFCALQWSAYLLHLIYGINYFRIIFDGQTFL
ncbi:MAG: hypothetical protein IJ608_11190 [Lachnospiraceae bacterium]|nr:hypothetical protein [Lachnospiraceae bacterium]